MPTQNNLDSSHLERQLAEAQTRAEKGEYAAAVSAVREAKSLAPKNVYVLAFEKQAEQLSELDAAKSLTEEQRTDILESIPSIIERALESSRSPGTLTDISALMSGPDLSQEKKEKAAALEWLKNQYFQHAHEYIRKGEYQHALAEIRRVYIIDPSNAIARDFEKQFEALAELKRGDSLRVYPSTPGAASGPVRAAAQPPPPQPGPPPPEAADSTPMMTEEWSSPQQPKREAPRPPRTQEKKKGKKTGITLLVVLILLALAILGALLYYYYQRNIYKKPTVTVLPASTSEQFIGAPAEAAEQSYLVSENDSSLGTPEVTELAGDAAPAPSPAEAVKKSPGPKKIAPPRTVPAEPAPSVAGQHGESTPPVMATQAQPDLRQPASQPKAEDTAAPAPFVAVEKQARIIRLERPKLPAQGEFVRVEGQVVIQVRIDATGKPVETVTLKSTNDLLIHPVIDAVMASQFAPAEMTTGPVASWLTIPFRFASR